MTTKKDFSHQASMKEYWEEQATFSNNPVKIVRTLPEDTPEFILKMMTEFEIKVAKFCFDDGHSGLILDVGCGAGNILVHALKLYQDLNLDYIGLDFSRNMLKKAVVRSKKVNAFFFQGNAISIPLRDDVFDRVVCSFFYTGAMVEIH